MSWMDKIGGLLKQYTSGSGAAAAPAPDVHAHFDQVAEAAPTSAIAEGLAAAFRSDQTPAFETMVSQLFANSNGAQKAGLLNQLIGSVNPAMLTQLLAGTGLAGALQGGAAQVTPEQAQQVTPEMVQQMAAHAQKTNPSIIESCSAFYAQHATLVKTLGGAALTIAMAKVAQRQQHA
jgi:hypothetical protein